MGMSMKVGSLCTGIAGLDLGLQMAGVETEPVFVSDIDEGANDWLAANMPDVPNLGDFTALDELPEVDIITAGFPCQPVSMAGQRQGINDERWIFDDIARLTSRMGTRPLLFLENVPGLLTANAGDAMGRVVHGLADIGYHITYGTLPASAVGAPHRRNRWWGLAYSADADVARLEKQRVAFGSEPELDRLGGDQSFAPDATSAERRGPQQQAVAATVRSAAESGEHHRSDADRFGKWAPAIARWGTILERPAPDPTDDGRLNPAFVEWMMGYPEGWVTDTLTNRRQSLHALGNAVVPRCAAQAFTQLAKRLDST
tara:strand:- start:475 stop:1419 length:945 start_codon:yes stop_codon:yes gene_type:complete